MTEYSEDIINNITVDYGGANAFDIYTREIEDVRQKKLTVVSKGVAVSGRPSGFKDNIIIDILREERRWNVIGYIDSADKTKLEAVYSAGGPTIIRVEGVSFSAAIEKYSIKKAASEMQDERPIQITFVEGIDFA